MKQKGDDYKITAVKYYLNNNDTMDNTCKIFNCKTHHYIDGYKYTKLKRIYKGKLSSAALTESSNLSNILFLRYKLYKRNYSNFIIDMFLHKENQILLWQTLQKSPYLIEFSQKFAGYREEWFRGSIEQFYTQWISRNNRVPNNAKELLEINKYALQTMVADLKRLLGYNASQQFGTNITSQNEIQTHKPMVTPTQNVNAQYELPTYDVNAERKQREDAWSENFNKYQTEYNQLLKQPAVPMRGLPSETGGEKIKNMDELIREHAKMRDMDLSIYAPPPPQKSPILDKPVPKLRILDEIERIEMQVEEHAEQPTKKSVRFEPDHNSTQSDEISSISQ